MVTGDGRLVLSLEDTEVPPPGPDEVMIRVEASPINPSDLGLLIGPADMSLAQVSGPPENPVVTAPIAPGLLSSQSDRFDMSLPAGNEGAGVVVEAGSSDAAQALLGKTVAVIAREMYAQYRLVKVGQCLELREGTTPEQGASCFVNPLTVLGMVETMRLEGHTALVHTAAASNLGQMLQKVCNNEGIELVNVVRRPEHVELLRGIGARYICDTSLDSFEDDLIEALTETGATLAFDATGGGPLANQLLHCTLSSTRRTCQEFPFLRGSASVGQTWLMSDHVRLEIDGAVAVVTMAKPPHNLLNGAFIDQLIQAFESAADAGGRAILLRSDMKHFSAGADVDGFGSEEGRSQDAAAVLERLEGVPLPTIAAVHGLALGGGFEVALACDFIICGASARLGLVEATLGLMPLLGGVQRVVDRAGASRGKEIAMFARRHDPVLLEKWGIVNVVVEDDELENAALSWARQLATGPNVSYAAIKRLAAITTSDGVRAADAVQDEAAKPVWASEDLQTGMTAYAETGPGTAIFQGR